MDKQLQEVSTPLADDLMIGAEKIAEYIYGDATRTREVYRNPAGLSFFKHGASVAAFKSTIRKELEEAQQQARENRQRLKEAPPACPVAKRRRRLQTLKGATSTRPAVAGRGAAGDGSDR